MLLHMFLPALVASVTVKVMTFNVWSSGTGVDEGTSKIAKHIKLVNPDVVGLQEVHEPKFFKNLMDLLGCGWKGVRAMDNDNAVISRHKVNTNSQVGTSKTTGVDIRLKTGETINVWSAHFSTNNYGPEAINYSTVAVTKEQLDRGEQIRIDEVNQVKDSQDMQRLIQNAGNVPIFFTGDFNSASHLDWIESTKHLHGNWTFEWPTTKILEGMGFRDSFREMHPDPLAEPGITWSTVYRDYVWKKPPPLDRIDFILYQGNARPIRSYLYGTDEDLKPQPDHRKNDYPSDHFAVITEFELN